MLFEIVKKIYLYYTLIYHLNKAENNTKSLDVYLHTYYMTPRGTCALHRIHIIFETHITES